jgi:exosortase K
VADLTWILQPTTWLVEALCRTEFVYEPGLGYLSRRYDVVIAPTCAGVNFFITTAVSLILVRLPSTHRLWPCVGLLMAAFIGAYAWTLATNAARIVLSLPMPPSQDLHRLLGIAVYVSSLLLLHSLSDLRAPARACGSIALGVYWTVTLVVPVLNGRAIDQAFFEHGAMVLLVSGTLAGIYCGLTRRGGISSVRTNVGYPAYSQAHGNALRVLAPGVQAPQRGLSPGLQGPPAGPEHPRAPFR